MPSKAFDLLVYMVQHPGRPLSKEELLSAIWLSAFVQEANLSQNVYQLRKALGQSDTAAPIIVTLPGRGSQFTVPVSVLPAMSAMPANRDSPGPGSPAPPEPKPAEEEAHYRRKRSRLVVERSLEGRVVWHRSRSLWPEAPRTPSVFGTRSKWGHFSMSAKSPMHSANAREVTLIRLDRQARFSLR